MQFWVGMNWFVSTPPLLINTNSFPPSTCGKISNNGGGSGVFVGVEVEVGEGGMVGVLALVRVGGGIVSVGVNEAGGINGGVKPVKYMAKPSTVKTTPQTARGRALLEPSFGNLIGPISTLPAPSKRL